MEAGFEFMFRGEFGPVFGDHDAVLMHLEEFDLFAGGLRAEDEPDGGFFAGLALVAVKPTQVQLHLAFVGGLEATELQLHNDQAAQAAMEEQEVDVEVFPV